MSKDWASPHTGHPRPASGPVQGLAEPWDEVQPSTDGLADRLDPKLAVGVEQRSAVEDGKRPDVLRPALLLRPDQHQIRCGHAIEPDRFAFDVRWIASSLHAAGRHLLCRVQAGHDSRARTVLPLPDRSAHRPVLRTVDRPHGSAPVSRSSVRRLYSIDSTLIPDGARRGQPQPRTSREPPSHRPRRQRHHLTQAVRWGWAG